MEATYKSTDRGMDKRVWYVLIYKMESIHPLKSEIMPFAARRLDLEIVILSKVRQRSRNITQHPLSPVLCLVASVVSDSLPPDGL